MAKYNCKNCGEPLSYVHSLIDGDTISPCQKCSEIEMDEEALKIIKRALKI